jgi:two-component system, OmpR family, sensor histidine kinase KdpD
MLPKAWRFVASLISVAAVLAVYRVLLPVNSTTVALTLLLVILGISTQWGLAEATAASVLAVIGFNFYFLPPLGTLTIQDPQNWVALLAFMVTAITASQLSARARRRAEADEARRREVEQLYALVQAMSLTGSVRKTIREFVHRVVQVFECEAAALYYKPLDEVFRSGPESASISDHELAVASEMENASLDEARGVALAPVRVGVRALGSFALAGKLPSAEIVRAMADMVAITIEKARAIEEASHAEAARQGEALKAALLDSLAHDIKTPLTSIKAAVTTLIGAEQVAGLPRELLDIINQGADRLNQLAAEVIAMARIEAGKLHLDKGPVPVEDLIEGALGELASATRGREIAIQIPADLPRAEADVELAREVVKQFVENAIKYSPEGPIYVTAAMKNGKIVIGVADRGPGIEENERALIFDKFFRGRRYRFSTKGTGMGLAIAKGIAEAHGERIWVESEPGQGAAFYVSLAPASAPEAPLPYTSGSQGPNGDQP